MKKIFISLLILVSSSLANAQDLSKVSTENTWMKVGVNAAVPLGNWKTNNVDATDFGIGLDVSVQFLETKANGIGLKAGYLNYFGKDNQEDIGVLPLAIMYRYYPESKGWFAGFEIGYSFISNLPGTEGAAFARPYAGLHFDYWNVFAYYDYISTEEGMPNLQAIGVGLARNVYFKKKS